MTTADLADLAAVAGARAFGPTPDAVRAVGDTLGRGLRGRPPAAVLWFAAAPHGAGAVAGPLAARFPGAVVLGCSTAAAITGTGAIGAIGAVAVPRGAVVRAVAALADLSGGLVAGVGDAVARLEAGLRAPLRSLDPARHLALLLASGARGDEAGVLGRLGAVAPALDVVVPAAVDPPGDPGRTVVAVGNRVTGRGAAVVVLETAVDVRGVRAAPLRPSRRRLRVTRTAADGHVVLEFDRLPAVEAYADALGIETDCVDAEAFSRHPVALLVDGEPRVRSPHATTPAGGIAFLARMPEGLEVEIVDAVHVGDPRRPRAAGVDDLGCQAWLGQLDATLTGFLGADRNLPVTPAGAPGPGGGRRAGGGV